MHRKLGGFRSLAEVAVVGASLEPGFLHGCYLSAVGWCDWVGVRDVVHCVEPVPALGLHSFQDQWYRRLLHLEDLLVGGVSYCLVCCRHEYCFVFPPVCELLATLVYWIKDRECWKSRR